MAEPVVTTTYGKIAGYEKDGLCIFKGIPYAVPPVGAQRWLAPQSLKPWTGIRDAKQSATIAPQNPSQIQIMVREKEPQNEDCLYLNIWTPGLDDKKRPVMVWIHGGAFVTGSGSSVSYNGKTLAKRGDTVIVTINYRLGLLGFLNLNEVTQGRIPATGTEGLLDQISALQWVKDNIAAFGGDPGRITIFGESAGGMSVGCLLTMPDAKGLFQRAIPQSGATSTAQPLERAAQIAEVFLHVANVKSNDVEALRKLPAGQLMAIQQEFLLEVPKTSSRLGTMPCQPVIDGKTLPLMPIEAVRKGASSNVAVMVGTMLNEWGLFGAGDPSLATLTEPHFIARLRRQIPVTYLPAFIETYRKTREQRGEPTAFGDLFTAIQTDRMFRMPAILLAEAKQIQKNPAFHYIFTWPSPALNGKLGACHAVEIGFVFGTTDKVFHGEGASVDALAVKTQDAWLAFARNGNPSCESLGKWPSYGTKRETMILGEKCYLANDPCGDERRAWGAIPQEEVAGI